MARKKDKLFLQLIDIAENMANCAKTLNDYEIKPDHSNLKDFSDTIKELESKGDTLVHETIVALNKAFITPIEHEDILQLAERMDEVVDGMEAVAIYSYMYNIGSTNPHLRDFKKYLMLSTEELRQAVVLLSDKKLLDIHEHTINVKTYEEECDQIERTAIYELFQEFKDNPIKIIELKDLYQMLEDTADNCQLVAKTLDMIVMKNM